MGINWVIIPFSLIGAIILIKEYFIDKKPIQNKNIILLFYYIAFAGLICGAIFADRVMYSGTADNLELRIFNYLSIFSTILATIVIFRGYQKIPGNWRSFVNILIIISIIVFSMNSLIKSTNDPFVTNFRIYYTNEEKAGLDWMEFSTPHSSIWFEKDIYSLAFRFNSQFNTFNNFRITSPDKAELLVLPQDPLQNSILNNMNKVYANSEVSIFKKVN